MNEATNSTDIKLLQQKINLLCSEISVTRGLGLRLSGVCHRISPVPTALSGSGKENSNTPPTGLMDQLDMAIDELSLQNRFIEGDVTRIEAII